MSSFNLFSMAVLLALVVVKGADLVANALVNPQIQLERNAYIIAGVSDTKESDQNPQNTGPDLEMVEPLLRSASIENGMKIAKKCLQCHSLEKGGKAKTGPNLWRIVQRSIGSVEGYAYSTAMKNHAGDWSYGKLNAYLYKPRHLIPGTKMSFAGLKKVQDRADLIAYLRTLSDEPIALPVVPVVTPDNSPETATPTDAGAVPQDKASI